MTRIDRYVLTAAGCGAVIVSAVSISEAMTRSAERAAEVGRWSVYQTNEQGWIVIDSVTGKLCTIPNAQTGGTNICADAPE